MTTSSDGQRTTRSSHRDDRPSGLFSRLLDRLHAAHRVARLAIPKKRSTRRADIAPAIVSLLLIIGLWLLPTGFEGRLLYQGSDKTTAEVLTVNNDQIYNNGLLKVGGQNARVRLLGGVFKGQETDAFNHLTGSLNKDKIFKPGDRARVVVDYTGDEIRAVNLIDHDRVPVETILIGIFILAIVLIAGRTGFQAILSFILAILVMWKLLVPRILQGDDPILLGMLVVSILTILIIASVYGFSIRAVAAIGGSLLGILITFLLSLWGTRAFLIHGAVMDQSESLIYAGFAHLDLTRIFMATIFIGASGAIMDLAVDITSAVTEVVSKKPQIRWGEAFRSAMNVGQAALGTMTTTLLLAYSGGYLVLMMVFMAQGTPLENILNFKEMAAEILHTLIGSLGLVAVAPLTAILAAVLLTRPRGRAEVLSLDSETGVDDLELAGDAASATPVVVADADVLGIDVRGAGVMGADVRGTDMLGIGGTVAGRTIAGGAVAGRTVAGGAVASGPCTAKVSRSSSIAGPTVASATMINE